MIRQRNTSKADRVFSLACTCITLSILWALVTLFPLQCSAGGLLYVFPPELEERKFAVARPAVLTSQTQITVSEAAIEYAINQTFHNDNDFPVRGIFLLPINREVPNGQISVRIDGVRCKTEILTFSRFFPMLRRIAVQTHDAGMLGLAGKEVLIVEPVTIGVNGNRTITIKYPIPFSVGRDHLDLLVPLEGERYSVAPVSDFEIRVRFKTARPVRALFSPSHHVSVVREGPGRCTVTLQLRDKRVHDDFRLVTTFSGDELDLGVFTDTSPPGNGTFMALLTPPQVLDTTKKSGKDIVFLVDSSGSMGQAHHAMAKQAVISFVQTLDPRDRLNVIPIGTRSEPMADRLFRATPENLSDAVRFIGSLSSGGGTDLYNALLAALGQFETRKRPCFLILVADGKGTVGITNPQTIVIDVTHQNRFGARVFALAFGRNVEVPLLSRLAESTGGKFVMVQDTRDVESALNRFIAGVSRPHVSNLTLESQGIDLQDVVPNPIPDLFRDETVAILGRYTAKVNQAASITLRAGIGGRAWAKTKPLTFSQSSEKRGYIPLLWAMRNLAQFIEKDRLKGPAGPLGPAIEQLSERFGFRPPFASWKKETGPSGGLPWTDLGNLLWTLKTSTVYSDVQSAQCRNVGGKIFRWNDGRWMDTEYKSSMKMSRIEFLGDTYFSVLEKDPEIGAFLALGPSVTFVRGDEAIEVVAQP